MLHYYPPDYSQDYKPEPSFQGSSYSTPSLPSSLDWPLSSLISLTHSFLFPIFWFPRPFLSSNLWTFAILLVIGTYPINIDLLAHLSLLGRHPRPLLKNHRPTTASIASSSGVPNLFPSYLRFSLSSHWVCFAVDPKLSEAIWGLRYLSYSPLRYLVKVCLTATVCYRMFYDSFVSVTFRAYMRPNLHNVLLCALFHCFYCWDSSLLFLIFVNQLFSLIKCLNKKKGELWMK